MTFPMRKFQGHARTRLSYRENKGGPLLPSKFEDQYECTQRVAQEEEGGKPIERPERPKPTNVVNLMDALRQSVEASGAATSTKAKSSRGKFSQFI